MKISDVVVWTAPFSQGTWLDESRISTPMNPYPRLSERRSSWRGPGSDLVWALLLTEDPEVFGIGQSRGGAVTAALIREHFTPLLVGETPAPRTAFERLRRASAPYAAGGVQTMALSAVELALWDLTARAANLPLVQILGGEPRSLPYYLTAPEPSLIPSASAAVLGGAAVVKVPMAEGPEAGRAGLHRNLERVRLTRELVPDHVPIAVDCFMSWDRAYTVSFGTAAKELGLGWIEEPLNPSDIAGHRAIREALPGIKIAAGEHLFGLDAGRRYLESDAVDILQVDVTWCGGISTASVLSDLAQEAGVVFAPHAAGLQPWSLHLLGAVGPNSLTEVVLGLSDSADPPVIPVGPGVGIVPKAVGGP